MSLKQLLFLITEFLNVENELRNSTNQILVFQILIPKFLKDEDTHRGIKKEKMRAVKKKLFLERSESVDNKFRCN